MRQILKPINNSRLTTINDDDKEEEGMVAMKYDNHLVKNGYRKNSVIVDQHQCIETRPVNLFDCWTVCEKENRFNDANNYPNKPQLSKDKSFVNFKQCSIDKNSKPNLISSSLSLLTNCIINLKTAKFKMCQQFYFAITKSLNTLINYPSIVINGNNKTVQTIFISLAIIILCSITYWNSLNGDFVHDDLPAIVQNPDVLGTTSIRQLFANDFWGRSMSDPESHKSYRPITTLTFRYLFQFSFLYKLLFPVCLIFKLALVINPDNLDQYFMIFMKFYISVGYFYFWPIFGVWW